ncbi:PaaD-like protein (DUF59) involved in Fe-S cluster assembly [hydrothermal vent metagenome]|uniref:PaaD-like protein (DUF59) involved in Fe-S cluster assembly n=1 Tax=hydrothermal vent metagenome TaxID=652676 RepID=A0A3B0TIE5_9ZZZZ
MNEDRDVLDVATSPEDSREYAEGPALPSHIVAPGPDEDSARIEAGEIVDGQTSGLSKEEVDRLATDIIAAIKTIYDPEIPVDIYELGLIYKIDIGDDRHIDVDMTLTAPGCPVAGEMPIWVEGAVSIVPGVSGVNVRMVFDPPWDVSRMSDEARVALNMW